MIAPVAMSPTVTSRTVARPARGVVQGQGLEGTWHTIEGTKLLARALQHEMDHLEGVLFIDHLSRLKREKALQRLKKARKEAEENKEHRL